MGAVSKGVWYTAVALILGYCSYNYVQSQKAAEEKAQQRTLYRAHIDANVADMVKKHGASTDWLEVLTNGHGPFRMDKIFTRELQELWIADRPILFMSVLTDISDAGEEYEIQLEPSLRSEAQRLRTNLRLALTCQKPIVDTLIREHQDVLEGFVPASIAVVAKIHEVRSHESRDSEGYIDEFKTGHGSCLAIAYFGD